MSGEFRPPVGSIGWCDLTVPQADAARDFYRDAIGWTVSEVDMGGYADYCMNQPAAGAPAAGVCWQRGVNEGLPPVWLVYFVVASLADSLIKVREHGGTVMRESVPGGQGRYAVVRDPAGAICALFEPA